jgi:hypothetical protein
MQRVTSRSPLSLVLSDRKYAEVSVYIFTLCKILNGLKQRISGEWETVKFKLCVIYVPRMGIVLACTGRLTVLTFRTFTEEETNLEYSKPFAGLGVLSFEMVSGIKILFMVTLYII